MIREVTFPLETSSENIYRGANRWATADKTAGQRKRVKEVLDEAFVPCAMYLPGWEGNRFAVTMTRISPLFIDDDNLKGALKSVRDEIAKWLGFKDDSHAWLEFKYLMQKCKQGYQGVRIHIACNEPGKDLRHMVGTAPVLVGEPVERATRNDKPPRAQTPLMFKPCFAAPPWAKVGPDEYDLIGLDLGPTPPERITMKGPNGQRAELVCTEAKDEDGPYWLYVAR
jgi:hypothetical protein